MQIFVLGTGRSGTHWVGNILRSHPEVRTTIEAQPIFHIATQAALRPERRWLLLPILRLLYEYEVNKSSPLHYVDKSHPVIWYADVVAHWFPEARFIGIERNPFATVASMLHHPGVTRWQRRWYKYRTPNPFLGIDESSAHIFGQLSAAEQASLRWLSHHYQLQHLREVLGGRLLVLKYEDLVDAFQETLGRLWDFLALHGVFTEIPGPGLSTSWRDRLSDEQIEDIIRTTGVDPGRKD